MSKCTHMSWVDNERSRGQLRAAQAPGRNGMPTEPHRAAQRPLHTGRERQQRPTNARRLTQEWAPRPSRNLRTPGPGAGRSTNSRRRHQALPGCKARMAAQCMRRHRPCTPYKPAEAPKQQQKPSAEWCACSLCSKNGCCLTAGPGPPANTAARNAKHT